MLLKFRGGGLTIEHAGIEVCHLGESKITAVGLNIGLSLKDGDGELIQGHIAPGDPLGIGEQLILTGCRAHQGLIDLIESILDRNAGDLKQLRAGSQDLQVGVMVGAPEEIHALTCPLADIIGPDQLHFMSAGFNLLQIKGSGLRNRA